MPGLLLPSRFNQQPQQAAQLDSSNPLTRGLDVAFVRLDQPGLVGAGSLNKFGTPSLATSKYGQGWYFANSTSDGFQAANWPILPDGTEYTILVVAQLSAVGGALNYLVNGDNVARSFQLRIETSGAPGFIGFNTAVGTASATGTVIPVGQVQAIAGRSGGGTVAIFQNGAKTGSVAASGTIKGQAASEIQIGNRNSLNLRGTIGLVLRWNRALSDAEAMAVTANPWQVLQAPTRRLWGASVAPANATGTFASTLAGATMGASGAVVSSGALAATLAGASMVASGSVGNAPSGSFASTLAGCSMAAAGQIIIPGGLASSLAGASMASVGTVTDQGAMSSTLAGASMTSAGIVASNATGTLASTLDGATMAAYGYNGVPPVLAGFFLRLPKNPRHVQRLP